MVSVLTFYSNNPCSNPTEALSVSLNFVFEKNENKQKEAWVGPFIFLTKYRFHAKTNNPHIIRYLQLSIGDEAQNQWPIL